MSAFIFENSCAYALGALMHCLSVTSPKFTLENNLSLNLNTKKTTYALKTPSVVALPFIYGVEYIIISN